MYYVSNLFSKKKKVEKKKKSVKTLLKYCFRLKMVHEAETHLEKAEKIMKITHGLQHPRMSIDCQEIRNRICYLRKMENSISTKSHNIENEE